MALSLFFKDSSTVKHYIYWGVPQPRIPVTTRRRSFVDESDSHPLSYLSVSASAEVHDELHTTVDGWNPAPPGMYETL